MALHRVWPVAACAVTFLAQSPIAPASSSSVAFVGVTVIPMDREHLTPNQTVVVEDGRITSMGPAASVAVPDGVKQVDAKGRFLIPALAEMHAHIPGGQEPDAAIEKVLFLYAANGIGTIRGMLGHPRHLTWRYRANRGDVLSPWIYTSGPSLNGNTVPTADAAVRAVREQKAAGYDFLKIHPGISRAPFNALAATAKEVGIRFSGHVPADVGLHRALESRYATIDHLDGYVEALADGGGSQLFGLNLVSKVDEARMPALVKATRETGVRNVPTQALLEHWVGPDDPEVMKTWPEMRFVESTDLSSWMQNKRKTMAEVPDADRRRFLEIRRRLIKALHVGGATLLLGSDAPQVWNVPGFSIHRELRYLVNAGLTPYQALETGTRQVASFFGTAADRGTIEAGKRADLVLLEGNPLEDISHTARIAAVVIGRHVLTREEIDRRLKALETR